MAITYKLIAKNILSLDTSSISFLNIPANYTDLMILSSVRTNRDAYVDIIGGRFNGNTSNYSHRNIYGDSVAAVSNNVSSGAYTYGWIIYTTANSSTSGVFAVNKTYIPNYNSNKNKSYSLIYAVENNSSTQNQAFVGGISGVWANTSAISSIDLIPGFGTNIKSGSSFYLYGIKKE